MPDPIRGEFANIGVAMVDDTGGFSKLAYNYRIQTRLTALGGRKLVQPVLQELGAIASSYEVSGVQQAGALGLLTPMTRRDLVDWAQSRGGIVRMTTPRVAMSEDPESAFERVFRRYVRSTAQQEQQPAVVTPEAERARLRDRFARALTRLQNFDPARIVVGSAVSGIQAHHWLDIAVVGHDRSTAFAHAIPLTANDDRAIYVNRGLALEAANDWEPNAPRFALYDDPPASRAELFAETNELFREAGIELVGRNDVDQAALRFDEPLLIAG
jgi:hypothetical protein